ncbi:5454_t:CDS:2, partial [Entrophospora sp. SA101]
IFLWKDLEKSIKKHSNKILNNENITILPTFIENLKIYNQNTFDALLDRYMKKFKSEAFEFWVIPVQKEFFSYLSFKKVTKLYGIQALTIQDLKQFIPGISKTFISMTKL